MATSAGTICRSMCATGGVTGRGGGGGGGGGVWGGDGYSGAPILSVGVEVVQNVLGLGMY